MTSPQTAIPVVFGAMTVGKPGQPVARLTTVEDANAILDVFQSHGHSEVDTARGYCGGTSEQLLAEAEWQRRGVVMETKLYPSKGHGATQPSKAEYTHQPEEVRRGLLDSLKALGADKIDMFYLHAPDRNTPFEATLSEINKLHQEGYFKRWGVSNFQSWEVASVCEICLKNNWVLPSAYQGLYNALQRSVEAELIPCLRHYSIGLYAFQPLAGGFLTGKLHRDQKEFEKGSRFHPDSFAGKLHQGRYLGERNFDALDILRPVAEKHGLTEAECGLRWMAHHSVLKRELKDAIIVGASSTKQLESNLLDLEKGPLPEDVVQALDQGWAVISGTYKYWH